jgi:hypothetical protein
LIEEDGDVEFTAEFDEDLQERAHTAIIQEKKKQQMEQRKKQGAMVGYHHGQLNVLPALYWCPEKMNLIQMMTLYLMAVIQKKVSLL